MKKQIIISFLIGVLVTLSFNGIELPNVYTQKPAQPKSWIVTYGSPSDLQTVISNYSKQGYIVHKLEATHYSSETMLVMYKYY